MLRCAVAFLSLIIPNFPVTHDSILSDEKHFVVMHSRDGGMFSVFMDVLSLIDCYEDGLYSGIEVNFEKEGLYYDENHGDNWWSYYCQPICIGEKTNVCHVIGNPPGSLGWIERKLTREQAHSYIEKYIHFKPEIMERVTQFQRDNFLENYVISVHYRGTDKISEAPPVAFETVTNKIDEVIKTHGGDRYKIFLATDEQEFLDYLICHYGDHVCYNTEAIRSTDGQPLHLGEYDRYQCGIDAIIDALLLSRGDYLIRMSSNLSRWSTFFNPDIPVYELNELYF